MHWYQLLGGVYCTFTICKSDGKVIGCLDVPGKNALPRSTRMLKHSLLTQCGLPYWVVRSSSLPTVAEIRAEFRHLTGRSATADISDADCNSWINEYYLQAFPEEAGVSNFQTDFTQDLTPTDSGEYALAQGVIGSLVYNRGGSLKATDKRREMVDLGPAIKAGDYERIAILLRQMKRHWPTAKGLRDRRENEARIIDSLVNKGGELSE
jgi:hypothetical protein